MGCARWGIHQVGLTDGESPRYGAVFRFPCVQPAPDGSARSLCEFVCGPSASFRTLYGSLSKTSVGKRFVPCAWISSVGSSFWEMSERRLGPVHCAGDLQRAKRTRARLRWPIANARARATATATRTTEKAKTTDANQQLQAAHGRPSCGR